MYLCIRDPAPSSLEMLHNERLYDFRYHQSSMTQQQILISISCKSYNKIVIKLAFSCIFSKSHTYIIHFKSKFRLLRSIITHQNDTIYDAVSALL